MDRPTLQRWLDGYVAAWRSNNAAAIGGCSRPMPSTATTPPTSPVRTRRDRRLLARGARRARHVGRVVQPFAVEVLAVATGVSTYFGADGTPERVYDNAFVMEFDEHGRCRAFTEWFRQRPSAGWGSPGVSLLQLPQPCLQARQVFLVVIGSRLPDPRERRLAGLGHLGPRMEHPGAGGDRLGLDVGDGTSRIASRKRAFSSSSSSVRSST